MGFLSIRIATAVEWCQSKGAQSAASPIIRSCASRYPTEDSHADFQMLEQAVKTGPEFAKLFGISTIGKASSNAADYPFILSDVAERLGGKKTYWYVAQGYIDAIQASKGINIKASDNRYHSATKIGRGAKSVAHKYSHAFIDLCEEIRNGADYELDL